MQNETSEVITSSPQLTSKPSSSYSNHRLNDNGVLIYPNKGKEPECPDGYERDPQDPFVFHFVLDHCEYRTHKEIELPCRCGTRLFMFCNYINNYVKTHLCKRCKEEPGYVDQFK